MSVVIGPFTSNSIRMDTSIRPQTYTPSAQKVSNDINAQGRVAMGERAFEQAMEQLSQLLTQKNIQVSTIYDTDGMQVSIVDGDSGKQIIKMPPDMVVYAVEKAKEHNIGWIVDMLL